MLQDVEKAKKRKIVLSKKMLALKRAGGRW